MYLRGLEERVNRIVTRIPGIASLLRCILNIDLKLRPSMRFLFRHIFWLPLVLTFSDSIVTCFTLFSFFVADKFNSSLDSFDTKEQDRIWLLSLSGVLKGLRVFGFSGLLDFICVQGVGGGCFSSSLDFEVLDGIS